MLAAYAGNINIESGWIQIGVGSVGGKEHDLSGLVAVIPKKSVEKTINKQIAALR